MYIYHALINSLSAHMIHINLNTIFCTHIGHSPTKTVSIRYYMETHTHTHFRWNSATAAMPLANGCGSTGQNQAALYIFSRLRKILNSEAKLIFEIQAGKHGHVQPLLRTLHWLTVQAALELRTWSCATCSSHSSLVPGPNQKRLQNVSYMYLSQLLLDSSPAYLSDLLLQIHWHFTSPMLK